jgi:predicted MFS family arabinose efflux permease
LLAGIGLAQAMTLYEPAFAVVARRYGAEARRGITALTLWGGFASTVFVPLIQFLIDQVDWRSTLVVLGLVNLALCTPLYLGVIDPKVDAQPPEPASATSSEAPLTGRRAVRWALHQRRSGHCPGQLDTGRRRFLVYRCAERPKETT